MPLIPYLPILDSKSYNSNGKTVKEVERSVTPLMSNIHKQIRIVKTPSPIVPLVKDYDLSKTPYDSYHWNEWQAPQLIGIPLVKCISLQSIQVTREQ